MSATSNEKSDDAQVFHLPANVAGEIRDVEVLPGQLKHIPVARRLAAGALVGKFIYALGARRWYRWDGARWRDSGSGKAMPPEAIPVISRWVEDELHRMVAERVDPKIMAAFARYRDMPGVEALMSASRGCEDMAMDIEAFDAHPHLLNTPTGVVDLRTGDLLEHDPSLLMTRITTAAYVKGATHPDLDLALSALPGDEERSWLQIRLGQSITGDPSPDDRCILACGGGSNGKTGILDAALHAAGSYAAPVMDSVLMGSASHPTERFDLRALRLAIIEELPEGRYLNAAYLKKVVGTGSIKARPIGGDPVEFRATHSLWITSNHLPRIAESDHGTWRRLAILDFPFTFVDSMPDEGEPGFDPMLRLRDARLKHRILEPDQQAAVLAWLVAGAVRYYQDDRAMPPDPDSVVAATQVWRQDTDQVGEYLAERLVLDPDAVVPTVLLTWDYNRWAQDRGHRAMSDRTLVAKVMDHPDYAGHPLAKAQVSRGGGADLTISEPAADRGGFLGDRPQTSRRVMGVRGLRFLTREELDR